MYKLMLVMVALLQVNAYAYESVFGNEFTFDPSEIAVPVVSSRANLTSAVAGTIVYDSTSGGFYGLPVGGSPGTAANWLQMSTAVGTQPVTSGGTERVERAKIYCHTSSSESNLSTAGWIDVGNNNTGVCTLTIASGIFNGTPGCVVVHNTSGIGYFATSVMTNSTSGTIRGSYWNGSTVTWDPSFYADIICVGPRA